MGVSRVVLWHVAVLLRLPGELRWASGVRISLEAERDLAPERSP